MQKSRSFLAVASLLVLVSSLARATVTSPRSLGVLADVADQGPEAMADAADNPGEKAKVKIAVNCPSCGTKQTVELENGVETEVACGKQGCGKTQKLTATVPSLVLKKEGELLAPETGSGKKDEKPSAFKKIIKSPVTWTLAGAAIGAGLGAIGGPATAVLGGILGALVGFIAHKIFGDDEEERAGP